MYSSNAFGSVWYPYSLIRDRTSCCLTHRNTSPELQKNTCGCPISPSQEILLNQENLKQKIKKGTHRPLHSDTNSLSSLALSKPDSGGKCNRTWTQHGSNPEPVSPPDCIFKYLPPYSSLYVASFHIDHQYRILKLAVLSLSSYSHRVHWILFPPSMPVFRMLLTPSKIR